MIAWALQRPPPPGSRRWLAQLAAVWTVLNQSHLGKFRPGGPGVAERAPSADPAHPGLADSPQPGRLEFAGTGDNEVMGGDQEDEGWAGGDTVITAAEELPPGRYFDREESWLRWNQRVLELAEDDSLPLLERVRFLSIFASNLDEFFMVRVAGRIRRMAAGLPVESVSGRSPDQILANTLETARLLSIRHAECFATSVMPALSGEGIEILRWKELSAAEQDNLQQLFRERIYPVLTPLVVDPAHPFPYISGLSLSLAVMMADPVTGSTMFARVKVPPLLPRFLTVSQHRFVPLEDVIAAHLPELFGGLDILEHHVFRVTRTRDLEVDEDVSENLLKSMEQELQRRRFEPAVRLEVEDAMSSDMLDKLVTELGVDRAAVYHLPVPLDLSGLKVIADLDLRRLKYPAFVPSESALPKDTDIFSALGRRDVLVHLPYDSFTTTVERLIVEAAADPQVLAIKQTLYPDQRHLLDRGCTDRRRRGGQAGGGGRRAEGTLRRAGEHHLGAQAGGSRLPCGVRDRRPEDPLQDGAGGSAGAGRLAAAVLPHRHRQLPPDHRPAV